MQSLEYVNIFDLLKTKYNELNMGYSFDLLHLNSEGYLLCKDATIKYIENEYRSKNSRGNTKITTDWFMRIVEHTQLRALRLLKKMVKLILKLSICYY